MSFSLQCAFICSKQEFIHRVGRELLDAYRVALPSWVRLCWERMNKFSFARVIRRLSRQAHAVTISEPHPSPIRPGCEFETNCERTLQIENKESLLAVSLAVQARRRAMKSKETEASPAHRTYYVSFVKISRRERDLPSSYLRVPLEEMWHAINISIILE